MQNIITFVNFLPKLDPNFQYLFSILVSQTHGYYLTEMTNASICY